MNTEYAPSGAAAASATGGREATSVLRAPATVFVATPDVAVTVADEAPGDVVRWGPIVAGVVTAFTVLLFLTVLGIALGLSAFGEKNASQSWGTAAGIWGGRSGLSIAFD